MNGMTMTTEQPPISDVFGKLASATGEVSERLDRILTMVRGPRPTAVEASAKVGDMGMRGPLMHAERNIGQIHGAVMELERELCGNGTAR